jgi:hypothetical protein
VVLLPIYFALDYFKNCEDKITLGKLSVKITDNDQITEYFYLNISTYQINGSKLSLDIHNTGKKTIDLSNLNLNRRDIQKLDKDLQVYLTKKKPNIKNKPRH